MNDPVKIAWFGRVIRRAVGTGALGAIAYDERPLEFTSIGGRIAGKVARVLGDGRDAASLATRVDQELAAAGLDSRLSYALLSTDLHRSVLAHVPRRAAADPGASLIAPD